MTQANSVEDALLLLESFSISLANKLLNKLSDTVEKRSMQYDNRYIKTDMQIAAITFDRQRNIRSAGKNGQEYIAAFKDL